MEDRVEDKIEDKVMEAKHTFSRLGWCYVAGTILLNVMHALMIPWVGRVRPEWLQNEDSRLLLSSAVVYVLALPLIYLLARKMPSAVPEKKSIKWWQFLILFLIGYALLFVSNIMGNIVTFIIGAMKGSQVNNSLLEYVTGGSIWMMVALMVIVAPIMEELIFRKVLVDRTIRYGQGVAVALSGLMFGLFHGNLNQFAYAVILGVFFAFIYIKTGDIRITMGLHALMNFMGSVVAGGLLKMIHYQELLSAVEDPDRLVSLVTQYATGWILYGLFFVFIMTVVISGIVLLIVHHRKFRLEPGEVQIPAGQRIQTLLLNPGMLFFCIMWIVMIILQLFS